MSTLQELKYPIGQFTAKDKYTQEEICSFIKVLSLFPKKIRVAVQDLTEDQLNTTYRPQGWTVRQLVHHCADSHMNSIIRFKLALTENQPVIKPYYEDRWAKLPDAELPIKASLLILDGVHERLVTLLHGLSHQDLSRTFIHPENGDIIDIATNIASYAWHSEHHLAHITNLRTRMNW